MIVIFDIYDTTNQGFITRDGLYDILGMLVGDSLTRDNLNFIVDHVFNDADFNNDGKISLSEFSKVFYFLKKLLESSGIEEKLSITFLK